MKPSRLAGGDPELGTSSSQQQPLPPQHQRTKGGAPVVGGKGKAKGKDGGSAVALQRML